MKNPPRLRALDFALGFIALGAASFAPPSAPAATEYFVAPSGNDASNGLTWASAKLTYAGGLAAATSDGDIVTFSNGIYTITASRDVARAITIRGYSGDYRDVIFKSDGGNHRMLTTGSSANNVTLSSVTVTNFTYNAGGGAAVVMFNGTITNCLFTKNSGTYNDAAGAGGAVRLDGGRIVDSVFVANSALKLGGALGLSTAGGSLRIIQNCVFSNNVASGGSYPAAGAIFVDNSQTFLITNCTFVGNSATDRAGAMCLTGSGTITACRFVSNSSSGHGGAIYNNMPAGGSVTVSDCSFTSNTVPTGSKFGGGMYTLQGNASRSLITNCTFTVNNAQWGAAYYLNMTAANTTSLITECRFYTNYAGSGAAVIDGPNHAQAVSRVTKCDFIGNIGNGDVGGGYANNGGALAGISLTDCRFIGNRATTGGGLYVTVAGSTITGCTIVSNRATTGNGGGGYFTKGTVANCIFAFNTANSSAVNCGYAGGIYANDGTVTIRNCVVAGNECYQHGAGIWGNAGAIVENCTVVGNRSTIAADRVAGIHYNNPGQGIIRNVICYSNTTLNAGYAGRNIYNAAGWPTVLYTCVTPAIPGTSNITSEPLLVNFGTGSGTNHVWGDYRLRPTSPCVNSGIDMAWHANSLELAAKPRLSGRAVDRGAYELPLSPVVNNATGATDVTSFSAWLNGNLVSTGAAPTEVWVYWGTTNGAQVKGNWQANRYFGFTNECALSNQTSDLVGGQLYYYSFYASNYYGDAWASPSNFTTQPASAPVIDNDGGAIPGATRAVLRGNLVDGAPNCSVWIYWGQDTNNWTGSRALGTWPEAPFAIAITGLVAETEYYYRCAASNSAGLRWAAAATNFTTTAYTGEYYVTPTGAGQQAGFSWDQAFSNVYEAVAAATRAGDTIYVKEGTYTLATSLSIANLPGLNIRGGYAGSGTPGALGSATLLQPSGSGIRIVNIANSTATLERVTLKGARLTSGNGGGLSVSGSDVTVSNCVVNDNQIDAHGCNGAGIYATASTLTLAGTVVTNNDLRGNSNYGGGVYANGGTLIVRDSQLVLNRVRGYHTGNSWAYCGGGALYGNAAIVDVRRSRFDANYVYGESSWDGEARGGAVRTSGGSVAVQGCDFSANYVFGYAVWSLAASLGHGGALFVENANPLGLDGCSLSNNYAGVPGGQTDYHGGAVYVAQGSYVGNIAHCTIQQNGSTFNGDIHVASGTVRMTNNLVTANTGSGIVAAGGTLTVANCTLADNTGWGLDYGAGTATVSDSIAWGNLSGGIDAGPTVAYTCAQESHGGAGNTNVNPIFVCGYYLSHAFVHDQTVDSPCVDIGSAAAATLGLGTRTTRTDGQGDSGTVDPGYHYAAAANLPEPYVRNIGDSETTSADAWVTGYLTATGFTATTVYLYWGDSDHLRDKGSWTEVDLGTRAAGPVSNQLTNLDPDKTYWFRFYATNGASEAWAEPSMPFKTLAVGGMPSINNAAGASNVTYYGAVLNGFLSDTGAAPTYVSVFWGTGDGETNRQNWTHTNAFAETRDIGLASTNIVGQLADGTKYYYTFYASNSLGEGWAEPSKDFTTPVDYGTHGAYVTTNGGGMANGKDWANAFSSVQDAVDAATNAGDTVYVKEGTYTLGSPVLITNHPGLFVKGGYAGSGGSPGALSANPSILRPSASGIRIVNIGASTATLERVTIRGGRLTNAHGAGLYVSGADLALTNCLVDDNQIEGNSGGNWRGAGIFCTGSSILRLLGGTVVSNGYLHGKLAGDGAGVYADGGTLLMRGCTVSDNRIVGWWVAQADAPVNEGAGVYVAAAALDVQDCEFVRNSVYSEGFYTGVARGGALRINGGSASIRSSRFSANYAFGYGANLAGRARGGALCADNVNPLVVEGCSLSSNYARTVVGSDTLGGTVYLAQGSYGARLVDCDVVGNGSAYNGDVYVASGTIAATNCLVARNTGAGVMAQGGAVRLVNCTLADNTGWGLDYGAATTVTVLNCIAWGNAAGGIENNAAVAVTYTCAQEAHTGTGNLNTDPLFVDAAAGDYHEKSTAGSWHNSAGDFVLDAQNSLCIDSGDASPFSLEPEPRGQRINLGRYGNTPEASKTWTTQTLFLFH